MIPNFTRVDDGDDDDGAGPEISNLFISYMLTIDRGKIADFTKKKKSIKTKDFMTKWQNMQ